MDRRSLPRSRPDGARQGRRSLTAAIPLGLAALVIAGGCGGAAGPLELGSPSTSSGPAATQPPTTDAPTTTTSAPLSPEEVEVRAVIDRFWPPYLEAFTRPETEEPVLDELLTGEANLTILGRFEEMARSHQRTISPEPSVFTHHVMTVTFPKSDQASVRECVVDDLQVIQDIDESSGLPPGAYGVIDDDVATVEVTTALVHYPEGWRITVRESTEHLEGVRDCGIFSNP